MQKIFTLLSTLALALLISGTATAGYYEVVYDLAGSELTTSPPGGLPDQTDPITGSWTVRLYSATSGSPVTKAYLMSGDEVTTIDQDYTVFQLTGSSNVDLLPPNGATRINVAGAGTLAAFNVGNSAVTGSNHCTGSFCAGAGFTASVPVPLTPTFSPVPAPRPELVFTTAVIGSGDFTSAALTQTASAGAVTLTTIYKGSEISRSAFMEPFPTGVPAMSGRGMLGLAAFLLVGGAVALARRSHRS
jgi:hypothetical protein